MTEPSHEAPAGAAPPSLPPAALERWAQLPQDAPLALALTRGDLDNLLLALRNLAIGQNELVVALAAHTQQDIDGCVEALMRANEVSRSAFARITAFIGAVMETSAPAAP